MKIDLEIKEGDVEMKEQFKKYLEEQFRKIRPTQAAMEYREETLKSLLDRAQELKIKGIEDEELVYLMCIDELGDFEQVLKEFDQKEIETNSAKRHISRSAIISIATIVLLSLAYVAIGVIAQIWHPTWLIIVGGIFASIIVTVACAVPKLLKDKKYAPIRIIVAGSEVLVSVFVFLILQLVAKIAGSYMVFLAMVAIIVGVDTVLAFAFENKLRWIELPVFVEIFAVMLFVLLGLNVRIWHPTWLLCLVGVVFAIVEIVAFLVKRNAKKAKKEKDNAQEKMQQNDVYWTKWSK